MSLIGTKNFPPPSAKIMVGIRVVMASDILKGIKPVTNLPEGFSFLRVECHNGKTAEAIIENEILSVRLYLPLENCGDSWRIIR